MTTDTPVGRITEYLRQRPLGRGQDPENISEIWFDPQAESIQLTASDLEDVLQQLDDAAAEMLRLTEFTESQPQLQSIRLINHDGSTAIGLKGGYTVEFNLGGRSNYLRASQSDDGSALIVSSGKGPRDQAIAVSPLDTHSVAVVLR